MDPQLSQSHVHGYERMAAWADLLDQINVFPVADADTGRNLKSTLAPIRTLAGRPEPVIQQVKRSATGNSGNIAAAFFSRFLAAGGPGDLLAAARNGRNHAWKVIHDPQPGTMLSLLDALVSALESKTAVADPTRGSAIVDRLALAVYDTTERLQPLKDADVVDAGALGLFLYFEGFWGWAAGSKGVMTPPFERFGNQLHISGAYQPTKEEGFCIDALVAPEKNAAAVVDAVSMHGESIVADTVDRHVKIHMHTRDRVEARRLLESAGVVLDWQDSPLGHTAIDRQPKNESVIHIVTDAAGSITRQDADKYGLTLLDSYLIVDDQIIPETHYTPESLYAAMRAGRPVSTAQASVFERHQGYQSVMDRYHHVIYLCVGSAFTGNANTARAWQAENDPRGRMRVVDTGAASGRLGLIALATAREAQRTNNAQTVTRFAEAAIARCEEYVFLDQLKFLARGGRISKTRGFVGDLLNMKPIISPKPSGAEKVGVVRNRRQQMDFAINGLEANLGIGRSPLILLQYSDNCEWVCRTAAPRIQACRPDAEILIRPLSLTSGAHMGPGTWAIAFLPSAPNSPGGE